MWIETLYNQIINSDQILYIEVHQVSKDVFEVEATVCGGNFSTGIYRCNTESEAKIKMYGLLLQLNDEKTQRKLNYNLYPVTPAPLIPTEPYRPTCPYPYVAPNTSPINPYTSPYCEPTITTPKVDWRPTWTTTTTNDLTFSGTQK